MASHQNRSGLAGAAGGIAAILAIVGVVFLTPRLWPLVRPPLWQELTALYEFEVARWLMLGAQIAAYPLVYCAIRMVLAALFAVILLQIERRMR